MKKIISSILIVFILFNFIFRNSSYSAIDVLAPMDGAEIDIASLITNDSGFLSISSILSTIVDLITGLINLFPLVIHMGMSAVAYNNGKLDGKFSIFQIEDAVFGKIGLFNVNFFNFSDSYELGTENKVIVETDGYIKTIKASVAKFFTITRLIACIISLLILIYVGIRMALASMAEDKAKYKKMLLTWFESALMLFFMQYIISAVLTLGDICSNIIFETKQQSNATSFEYIVIKNTLSVNAAGFEYLKYCLIYWLLVFIQAKFFLFYGRRMITVGFLILIAPLVTITYPIDKMGDGKAQAFSVWFYELLINVLIQPIHALIYLIFMYTAGDIAKYSVFVAAIFLFSLTKVEKVVLQLFNLKNVTSLKPVDEEMKKRRITWIIKQDI